MQFQYYNSLEFLGFAFEISEKGSFARPRSDTKHTMLAIILKIKGQEIQWLKENKLHLNGGCSWM
jgi:hypothetical protein